MSSRNRTRAWVELKSRLHDIQARNEKVPCDGLVDDFQGNDPRSSIDFASVLCGSCPVLEQCYRYAESDTEATGIWGGKVWREGKID